MSGVVSGFLFVHGIQGHPRQFQFLIDRLPEGTPYRNVLLPGHGADVKAFRRSGREAWQAAVREAAGELRGQCGQLVFVGHSMGCLLGLLSEQAAPGTFSDMLLLCCSAARSGSGPHTGISVTTCWLHAR
ncbi:MAG: alpha/beta hydrolase [Acidaminococcaceae bacterium]|nr:alpha/beta hydrolase [Acidaminococcaceae bacterium]